jgi:hypothetical protein
LYYSKNNKSALTNNITSFYLSTDMHLFYVIESNISIINLNSSEKNIFNITVSGKISGLAVYEVQNYPINGSY